MALERDFITPAGAVIQTTANVVGNTTSVDMFGNTQKSLSFPIFTQNFGISDRLDSRFVYVRNSNATYIAANGLIVYANNNQPRFEYDPVTLQGKGLLMEEGRTNMVYGSSNMGGLNWSSYDGLIGQTYDIITNAGTAPDGSNTATFFRHTTDISTYYVMYPTTVTPFFNNVTYTYSVFAKANTNPQEPVLVLAQYDATDNNNSVYLQFNTAANGAITSWVNFGTSANIHISSIGVQPYPNGWNRIYYSFRYTSGTRSYVQFKHEINGSALSASTNRVRGVYWWGAQCEQGPFVTSYIPTTSTSTATRTVDLAYISGANTNSIKNPTSMTIVDTVAILGYHGNTVMTGSSEQRFTAVWELRNLPAPASFAYTLGFNYGAFFTAQSTIRSYFNSTTTPHAVANYMAMFNNNENYLGFPQSSISVNNYITDAAYITCATTMRDFSFSFAANGVLHSTGSSRFAGDNNNYFQIGPLNGYFKSLTIYGTKLSNSEVVNITQT
jgi:hypothetical protein